MVATFVDTAGTVRILGAMIGNICFRLHLIMPDALTSTMISRSFGNNGYWLHLRQEKRLFSLDRIGLENKWLKIGREKTKAEKGPLLAPRPSSTDGEGASGSA
jgi:hypothetical protein